MQDITHKISSAVEACLYTRQHKVVKGRALVFGAMFSGVFMLSLVNAGDVLAQAVPPAAGGNAATLSGYATKVSGNTNVVVDIISYLCYIGGAGLAALGIVDLKKHVENPGQNPVKNGLAKLGFGGILLALPFVTNVMQGTMMGGEENAKFKEFKSKGTI